MCAATSAFAQPEVASREWENLDAGTNFGPIGTPPSCVSRAPARIDCFALGRSVPGSAPGLMRRQWNGSAWIAWENLGGDVVGPPECVSWGAARIDCFVRGSDNSLRHAWWEGAPQGSGGDITVGTASLQTDALFFGGWDNLGGSFTSEISCVSWDVGRIDCFVRGTDNALWHRWWDGSQWRDWESLGGQLGGRPECVSWSAFRIDCFALDPRGRMQHRWWNVTQWQGWEDLGGPFRGDISCISYVVNRIDCFARGGENALWARSWNGTQWIGENLGGLIKDPECISWGPGRIDCIVRSIWGTEVYHRAWELSWRNWERLADSPIYDGAMSCTSWRAGRIDCFDTSAYGRLRHIWWDGQRWWPSEANPRLTPEPSPPPPPPRVQSPRHAPAPERPPREGTNRPG